MQITLYKNFAKVSNSTKRPSDGTTYDCKFKDNTSYHNPQVLLAASLSDLAGVTFGYMDGNYYYVDEIESVANGLTQVSLSDDPLASWKEDIANYQGFMERGPVSTTFDDWAYDDMINPLDKVRSSKSAYTTIAGYSQTAGVYVMKTDSIFNPVGGGYLLTGNEIESVLSQASATSIDTSKILDIKYYPIALSAVSNYTNISSVHIGSGSVAVAGRYLGVGVHVTGSSTLAVPDRVYNDSRDYDPRFTETILRVFGHETSIDNLYLRDGELTVQSDIDLSDGIVRVQVYGDNKYAFIGTAPIGVSIPVTLNNNAQLRDIAKSIAGQSLNLRLSTNNAIISGLFNSFALSKNRRITDGVEREETDYEFGLRQRKTAMKNVGNAVTDSKRQGLQNASNNILSQHSVAHTIGSAVSGAIGDLEVGTVFLEVIRYATQDADRPAIGYPILSIASITGLNGETGFYKFRNPHLAVADIKEENDTINSYLASGFYYE